MSASPANKEFYESNLSAGVQSAVGRVITCWAAIEMVLPFQVGRLIATRRMSDRCSFAHDAYSKGVGVVFGSPARPMVVQIVNLLTQFDSDAGDAAKKIGDKLLKKKDRRDDIAHCLAMPKTKTAATFTQFGMARSVIHAEKNYSISDMDEWTHAMKRHALALDRLITKTTGWSWKRIEESWPQDLVPPVLRA